MLPELAPDDRTWAQETEEEFERSYLDQLEEIGAEAILEHLERLGGGRPVILPLLGGTRTKSSVTAGCWDAFLYERIGQAVPELEPGMLPQREKTPEPRLF